MVHSTTSTPLAHPTHPCSLLILFITAGTLIQLLLVAFALLWARERQRRVLLQISVADDEDGLSEEERGLLRGEEWGFEERERANEVAVDLEEKPPAYS